MMNGRTLGRSFMFTALDIVSIKTSIKGSMSHRQHFAVGGMPLEYIHTCMLPQQQTKEEILKLFHGAQQQGYPKHSQKLHCTM